MASVPVSVSSKSIIVVVNNPGYLDLRNLMVCRYLVKVAYPFSGSSSKASCPYNVTTPRDRAQAASVEVVTAAARRWPSNPRALAATVRRPVNHFVAFVRRYKERRKRVLAARGAATWSVPDQAGPP